MSRDDDTGGAADLAQLFHCHDVGQHIAACTADLSREIDAHHAQLAHLFDGLLGEVFLCVNLLCQRLDFVLSKLAVHFLHHLLLLGQSKIHRYILLTGLFSFTGIARCKQIPPGRFPRSREKCLSELTAGQQGSWCGLRCKRRSPYRSCSPDCRRAPSCESAGRHGTCCRRSRCTARP